MCISGALQKQVEASSDQFIKSYQRLFCDHNVLLIILRLGTTQKFSSSVTIKKIIKKNNQSCLEKSSAANIIEQSTKQQYRSSSIHVALPASSVSGWQTPLPDILPLITTYSNSEGSSLHTLILKGHHYIL